MPLRLSKHRILLDGIPLNESQSTPLPSAATLDIWSVSGNVIPLSGSATITGFTPAPQPGTKRTLLCTGTPSFTHSTNLLLPGSANYTAIAGDRIEVLAVTTTQFRLSVIKASVLPDVQFAKDASGNVTGLLGPDGLTHATLGKNVLTVGAGGRFSTIQGAIDSISLLPQFTAVSASMTITAWPQGSDTAIVSGTFAVETVYSAQLLLATHPALSGRLYPIDALRANTSLVFSMRRIEAGFSGSEALSLYQRKSYIILMLDDQYTEDVVISTPVNILFVGFGHTTWKGKITAAGTFNYGLLEFEGLKFSDTGGMFLGNFTSANAIRVVVRNSNTYGVNDSAFELICGDFTWENMRAYLSPVVPTGHQLLVTAQGDIRLLNSRTILNPRNNAVADHRLLANVVAVRNIIIDGVWTEVNDTNGSMNKVTLLQDTQFPAYITNSGISYISPVASSCQLAIASDSTDGGAVGAGSCLISRCGISANSLHTGTRTAFKANNASSTTAVVIDDCGALLAEKPVAGTLSFTDTQDIAYAAIITPNCSKGRVINVGVLTGNITINAPLNPRSGQIITFSFSADATVGRTIAYNTIFKSSAVPASTANGKASHQFMFDGTNWVQTGGALVWL